MTNNVTHSDTSHPPRSSDLMSTLTLTASSTAATGMSTVTITGTSGTLSHTTTLALTVNATGATPTVTPSTYRRSTTIANSYNSSCYVIFSSQKSIKENCLFT